MTQYDIAIVCFPGTMKFQKDLNKIITPNVVKRETGDAPYNQVLNDSRKMLSAIQKNIHVYGTYDEDGFFANYYLKKQKLILKPNQRFSEISGFVNVCANNPSINKKIANIIKNKV